MVRRVGGKIKKREEVNKFWGWFKAHIKDYSDCKKKVLKCNIKYVN
jgi:hypothetical protein